MIVPDNGALLIGFLFMDVDRTRDVALPDDVAMHASEQLAGILQCKHNNVCCKALLINMGKVIDYHYVVAYATLICVQRQLINDVIQWVYINRGCIFKKMYNNKAKKQLL